jgi:hypothetical protein
MTIDAVGVPGGVEGRGDGAGADAFHQRCDRRGVAQPRAVVDVVGAEALADQLLEQIGFLVGALGRAEAGKARRRALRGCRFQAGGALSSASSQVASRKYRGDGFVQRHEDVAALGRVVAADQRLGQALRAGWM